MDRQVTPCINSPQSKECNVTEGEWEHCQGQILSSIFFGSIQAHDFFNIFNMSAIAGMPLLNGELNDPHMSKWKMNKGLFSVSTE